MFWLRSIAPCDAVREWREAGNEAIFKMEAGTRHGFNLRASEAGVGGDAKGKFARRSPLSF